MSQFNEFNLNQTVLGIIEQLSFKQPTDIQKQAIPAILNGRSVIGQSHTGSGKTHAFLLPLFNQLESNKNEVQFVITSPTRELARQLYDEVRNMVKHANKEGEWTSRLLIGGSDRKRMAEDLKTLPNIIVGTPGRILDLVKDGALSIYTATTIVVDEADLMLDLGFIDEIDQLLIRCKRDIQILAFSATIPQRLEHFFNKYLENPLHIRVNHLISPETLKHQLIAKRHREAANIIYELSQVFQPYLALIFTNGQEQAEQLYASLLNKGLDVGLIHGGLTSRERRRILKDIEGLRYQYIVATDLASRGINIEGVSHVINAELPKEEHFYIHRVGRTARAGMDGVAISFYDEEDLVLIEKLEKSGIQFVFSDVRNGQWVEAKRINERRQRKRRVNELDQEAWKRVKKPKKVKPGYKKKMKEEQERIKRRLARKTRRKR